MYASINFKTKKAFKEAIARGQRIMLFQPGIGEVPENGKACVEGPYSPQPHTWYAEVLVKDRVVVKVS